MKLVGRQSAISDSFIFSIAFLFMWRSLNTMALGLAFMTASISLSSLALSVMLPSIASFLYIESITLISPLERNMCLYPSSFSSAGLILHEP